MVVLKNQNRRSGIFYLRPLCGFGFFSKSDFSAIFFSHFRSSTDSFLKFSLSRLQINAKYACSVSLSWLTISPAVSSISFSGLSSGTLKKSSLCVSRRARAIRLCPVVSHSGKTRPHQYGAVISCLNCVSLMPGLCFFITVALIVSTMAFAPCACFSAVPFT